MLEMFGIYALLLAGWGLWQHRRTAADASAAAPEPVPTTDRHERGAAARRHLNRGS